MNELIAYYVPGTVPGVGINKNKPREIYSISHGDRCSESKMKQGSGWDFWEGSL